MSITSMEAEVSWRKPEQIYFCWRIYAILATLWTNEEAKTPPILCASVRNRDLQWWQAAETHMPPLLHLSNIASFLKFPSTPSMASWQKAHQFCSSYTLAEQLLSNRLITERVETYGSPPQSKSQTRFAPNLPLKSVTVLLFQNTDTSVELPDRSTYWGLIRATRCARVFWYLCTFYLLLKSFS